MAWIQGKSIWWRDPSWAGDGWMMSTDELDGEIVMLAKKSWTQKRIKEVLFEAGFLVSRIKLNVLGDQLGGYKAWTVTMAGAVPDPKTNKGSSTVPNNDEAMVRFHIMVNEREARALWKSGTDARADLLLWFGGLGKAKRAVRRAFGLIGKNPGVYSEFGDFSEDRMRDGSRVVLTGDVRVSEKGEIV